LTMMRKVLRAEVVDVRDRHDVAKVRVPSDGEVHSAMQRRLRFGVQAVMERRDGSVEQGSEASTSKDECPAA